MITEEQKTKLWQLIDDYAGAEQVVAISAIYGNGLPEEYDELIRSKNAISDFMETLNHL
ncbi:hypothetical protein vBKpnAMK5_00276 [Klebsiella phage vB_Kpn_AM_K5]